MVGEHSVPGSKTPLQASTRSLGLLARRGRPLWGQPGGCAPTSACPVCRLGAECEGVATGGAWGRSGAAGSFLPRVLRVAGKRSGRLSLPVLGRGGSHGGGAVPRCHPPQASRRNVRA